MKGIILMICLFSLYICQNENPENIQKALLIKTNLTKEELTQLLLTKSENNNTSVEEVQPESESETESILKSLKNGKLKIKIKFELDLKDKAKKEAETEKEFESKDEGNTVQTAFIQTSVPPMPEKVTFVNYIFGLLIALILISLFALSSHFKKQKKIFLNNQKKSDDYLLEDN